MRTRFRGLLIATVAVILWCAAPLRAQTCDDADVCTSPDLCSAGTCTGTPVSGGVCDDGNECTGNDTCASGVCVGTPVNGSCDDHNPCTTDDTCVDGECHGTPVSDTPCGIGECGVCMSGQCVPDLAKQAMPCTDGFGACTEDDVCLGTICLGTFITCQDSDQNRCTVDACNPLTGQCQNFGPLNCGPCEACNPESGQCENAHEGDSCDDLNSCTGNGTCFSGACTNAAPVTPGDDATPTGTPTGTAQATATVTTTPTEGTPVAPTETATGTPTGTAQATATVTDTPTEGTPATPTDTPLSPTETATATPTGTAAATLTATTTATGTPTGTVSATVTATSTPVTPPPPTGTATATLPATVTRTASATATPLPVNSTIIVNGATGLAGTTVTFTASLQTTAMVAGTQNDITFDPKARVAANEDGSPKCTVNSEIDKPGTSFAFLPTDCTPGTNCTAVRALVLALDNTDPIMTGSVLYSCDVEIAADATGSYPLTCSNPGAGDPDGHRLGVDCTSGTITVSPPGQASIVVDDINGAPGEVVPLQVTLQTAVEVARTQNDITFEPEAPIAALGNGKPECVVNPAIEKDGSSFAFLPVDCTVGSTCTGVRALILSLTAQNAIPNGAVLYTCQVAISATAATGTYPLTCSSPGAEAPDGSPVGANCVDGSVVVGVQPTSTSTATPSITQTLTPSPTGTPPTATPTLTAATPTSTSTATVAIPTPTGTRTPRPKTEDDGCQIAGGSRGNPAWILLVPAALLLAARRRRQR